MGSIFLATVVTIVLRTWNLDPLSLYLLWSLVVPVLLLSNLTFLPLPCSVFAWFQANRENKTTAECFAWSLQHAQRLIGVIAWLVFSYFWWFLLGGLPMLFLWARTCQAPMVALFEDQPRIFRRSRQLTKEDSAIHVLAGLFLLLTLVLGSLIPMPRLVLISKMFEGEWTRVVQEFLWAFEMTSGILLFCIVAISWTVCLTLFYHDLRQFREGEAIRGKVRILFEKHLQNKAVP